MAAGDGGQLVLRGVGAHALEEHADLELPTAEVGAQDLALGVVGQLLGGEGDEVATVAQLAGAGGPQVPHPLRLSPGGDQVAVAVVVEHVDHGAAPLARAPAADPQLAGAPDAY